MEQIINIREHPDRLDRAADSFASWWGIDQSYYRHSMRDSLFTDKPVPRWFLMQRNDTIIGGCGLVTEDAMADENFSPWLCGLYIEPAERGHGLGAKLLAHGCREAAALGFSAIYLNTDHIGYYEKYAWRYIGDFAHQSGVDARVYRADTPRIETARLVLRPFTEGDAAAASHNSKQPIAAHFMSDMVLSSQEAAVNWIRWLNNDKFDVNIPCVVLAVVLKPAMTCIGLIGVAPKRELNNDIEILYTIADAYHNNGYATEAGQAMTRWAFEKAGQKMLTAIVKPANTASVRVIEKLGFIYMDTRILPYDGADCEFHCYRLHHQ